MEAKRRLAFKRLHGVISQKSVLFITTAVRSSSSIKISNGFILIQFCLYMPCASGKQSLTTHVRVCISKALQASIIMIWMQLVCSESKRNMRTATKYPLVMEITCIPEANSGRAFNVWQNLFVLSLMKEEKLIWDHSYSREYVDQCGSSK
jgi:hypothetical protein